ncbi:MAG: DUF2807 domain-containing protein [Bacteroidales bacterium]|nr:DUF2807 domain-containing protein [Bacteroidales bacterium]
MTKGIKNWFVSLVFIGTLFLNAHAEKKDFNLKNFKGIEVGHGLPVSIQMDTVELVSIESDNGIFDDIELKLEKGILKIKRKMFGKHSSNPRISVKAKYLEKLMASGGASIKVAGEIVSDYLNCECSGGSNISATTKCKFIETEIASGSQLKLTGSAKVAKITCSSGAAFKGDNLVCGTAKIAASSGSSLTLVVSEEILGEACSGANVIVKGKPANRVNCSSGANVVFK